MRVTCHVPHRGDVELPSLLAEMEAAGGGVPFGDDVVALAAAFGAQLLTDPASRTHPELMTLGFFMRRTEIARMKQEFESAARPDIVRVPQGLVFHVPPANVDTIFVYSWILSMLAGNANIVRLSSRASPVVDRLCEILDGLLAQPDMAPVRSRVAMIRYPHDDAINAAISQRSALRVIWGGDATIDAIRRAPLAHFGRDLTFADRASLVVMHARSVCDLDATGIEALAEALYNDIFWFDQLGCSSPRTCLWVGDEAAAAQARERAWPAVARVAERRGHRPEPSTRLNRELFVYRAVLDAPIVARADYGPVLTTLRVDRIADVPRDHPGGGLLYESVAPSLAALDPWLTRKDQTLTHFGMSREELASLVTRLGGRAIDRLVPVGQALQMARFWDGYDLGNQFVRHVHLVTPGNGRPR